MTSPSSSIQMSNFFILLSFLTLTLFSSSSLSSQSSLNKNDFAIIAATPALLPNPPRTPYVAVSPDIAPLFPTPGGNGGGGDSMPTIPSTRSPPNPDATIGPDAAAVAPSGALPESSAGDLDLAKWLGVGCVCFLAYWLVNFRYVIRYDLI
ncbi:classical arabinogalactan protein 26-like [Andrographis paniculata]|uniref:classical arabinogalactan protein 26-like n=1 Tax=Andrographis paniculata TaxID=175694 RepID=UPI0021E915A9|nr:classical arabinogalactan protein 26-like [Andrographis paniculata]